MDSNASSPLSSEQGSVFGYDADGNEVTNELEQLGVDLVDQNDLEKSLMEKVCLSRR